jgi:lysyl-tRNA synthetase class 1
MLEFAMSSEPPPDVAAVLSTLDARNDIFKSRDVESAIFAAVKEPNNIDPKTRRGIWTEWAAFALQTRETSDGGPWKMHFQPRMSGTNGDGSPFYVPDLREADAETLAHWSRRAKEAKHPVLVARYADLVWATTEFVTKGKRPREAFELARLAIDAYIAAADRDSGYAWSDTRDHLGRALDLARSINDEARTRNAIAANIRYVDRTADDNKIGTYCYLFSRLLPAEKAPTLTDDQERSLVEMFEKKFEAMMDPAGPWNADPHGPQNVGTLLADYYRRKSREEDRVRILRGIAGTMERRARAGDPIGALYFLEEARCIYLEAGLRSDAERVQREAQEMGPKAMESLKPITAEFEVKPGEKEAYVARFLAEGLDVAIKLFAHHFVTQQNSVRDLMACAMNSALLSRYFDLRRWPTTRSWRTSGTLQPIPMARWSTKPLRLCSIRVLRCHGF